MRPYVRPLVVTFSTLALATLFSYLAVTLTEPEASRSIRTDDARVDVRQLRAQFPEPAAVFDKTPVRSEEPPKGSSGSEGVPFCGEGRMQRVLAPEELRRSVAFKKATAEAAGGDPGKLMVLANFYLLGIGTEKNVVEAARLHSVGAAKGDARCQFAYGCELIQGLGLQKDPTTGLKWIRKAADQRNAEAEYRLHAAYRDGDGVAKDEETARDWLLKAAEHGQDDARVRLAEEILISQDKNRYKAVAAWVRPGATKGHRNSCHVMSFVYYAGIGVKADPVESVAWRLVMLNADDDVDRDKYRHAYDALSETEQATAEKRAKELCGEREYKSAYAPDPKKLAAERQKFERTKLRAEAGDANAQYELSEMLEDGEGTKVDQEAAVLWLRKAAEHAHAKSQYALGLHLRGGDGVMPDPKEAYIWFRKAAEQGDEYAERALAVCLRDGEGVTADHVESMKWLLRAAEHGQPMAQWEIGREYFDKEPDLAKDAIAVRWFRKSAERLNDHALIDLGYCYINGRGVTKDRIEGLAWMALGEYDDQQKALVRKFADDFTEEELNKVNERAIVLKNACREKFMASRAKPTER